MRRSFRIFATSWWPITRAALGPLLFGLACIAVAFLILGTVNEIERSAPRAYVSSPIAPRVAPPAYLVLIPYVIGLLAQPLLTTPVVLGIAQSVTGTAPHPPTFGTAWALWPAQFAVGLLFFGGAAVTFALAGVTWTAMVVRSYDPLVETAGVAIAASFALAAALLAFFGTLASIDVALRKAPAARAAAAALEGTFRNGTGRGIAGAALFALIAFGGSTAARRLVSILLSATHFWPLAVLFVAIPFVFGPVAAIFAFLFAQHTEATKAIG